MLIVDNMAPLLPVSLIPQDHMNMQIINTLPLSVALRYADAALDTFLFSKNKASKDVAALSLLPRFCHHYLVIYGLSICL